MLTWQVHLGSALDVLRELPDGCANCVCTSPPYWGLRDYGTARWEGGDPACGHLPRAQVLDSKTATNAGALRDKPMRECRCGAVRVDSQLGLERTPDAYVAALVAVFVEVRCVLRDDGVAWLNCGDSYATGAGSVGNCPGGGAQGENWKTRGLMTSPNRMKLPGLKPKDLVMVPARTALALQAPHYAGTIKRIEDRVWLAAMLDAEGCLFIHKRKAGQHNGQGYYRQNDSYSPGVEIANTSQAVIERIAALVGKGSICSQGPQENDRRKQTIYRWNLRTNECREFVRELYPHLVAKRQQARILYGCPSSGERAEASHAALIALHRIGSSDVDFPEIPSLFSPGWYLRSDVIWSKANPMPESVTDRPTKAHEYVFLLTKRERYAYNADAIREPVTQAMLDQIQQGYDGEGTKDYEGAGVQNPSSVKARIIAGARSKVVQDKGWNADRRDGGVSDIAGRGFGANARTVWTIPTEPSPYEHFAVMPRALARKCILAGCPYGGTVLDPFCGTGTSGVVALEEGRNFIGIELNSKYHAIARERLANVAPLLASERSA